MEISHQFWLIFRNTTKARETCTAVTWSSVLQALCSATLQRCVAKKFSKSSMYRKSCISVLYWYLSKCRWQTWFWITWSCTAEDRGRLYKARPADSFRWSSLSWIGTCVSCDDALKQGNILPWCTIQKIKSSQSIQLPAHSSAAKNPRSASVLMGFPASRCGNPKSNTTSFAGNCGNGLSKLPSHHPWPTNERCETPVCSILDFALTSWQESTNLISLSPVLYFLSLLLRGENRWHGILQLSCDLGSHAVYIQLGTWFPCCHPNLFKKSLRTRTLVSSYFRMTDQNSIICWVALLRSNSTQILGLQQWRSLWMGLNRGNAPLAKHLGEHISVAVHTLQLHICSRIFKDLLEGTEPHALKQGNILPCFTSFSRIVATPGWEMARNNAMLQLLEIDDVGKSGPPPFPGFLSCFIYFLLIGNAEFTVSMQKKLTFRGANVFFAEQTRICGKYQGSVQISHVLKRWRHYPCVCHNCSIYFLLTRINDSHSKKGVKLFGVK